MKKSEIVIYHSSQSQKRNVGGISDKKPNPIGKQIIQNTFKATKKEETHTIQSKKVSKGKSKSEIPKQIKAKSEKMIGRLDTGGKVREEIVEVKVVGNKPARRANSPSGLPTKTIKHKHRDIQGGNLQIIENFGRRKSPLTKKETHPQSPIISKKIGEGRILQGSIEAKGIVGTAPPTKAGTLPSDRPKTPIISSKGGISGNTKQPTNINDELGGYIKAKGKGGGYGVQVSEVDQLKEFENWKSCLLQYKYINRSLEKANMQQQKLVMDNIYDRFIQVLTLQHEIMKIKRDTNISSYINILDKSLLFQYDLLGDISDELPTCLMNFETLTSNITHWQNKIQIGENILIEPTDLIIAMQALFKWATKINSKLYPLQYNDVSNVLDKLREMEIIMKEEEAEIAKCGEYLQEEMKEIKSGTYIQVLDAMNTKAERIEEKAINTIDFMFT